MPAVFLRQTEYVDDEMIAMQIKLKPFDKGNGKRYVDIVVGIKVSMC